MLRIGLVVRPQQLLQRAEMLRRMVRAARARVCSGRPAGAQHA